MIQEFKQLIEKQREYLNYFLSSLDLEQTEKIAKMLFHCPGIIFFSGVGKSGFVAKKIAVSMVSTGTRALYLSPIGALHGDLGMVTSQDLFIFLSKSGESDELLNLVTPLKNKGATLIGIVSNPKSRLGNLCHEQIILPLQGELCPFDMAPTISTTIQMMFGDLLTVALMKLKKFSLDQFALNHPSGRIGKRMTVKVKDLMLTGQKIPLCSPQSKIVDILVELSDKRCGCILVADDSRKLLGIFTDGDLRRALQKQGGAVLEHSIVDHMTKNPRWLESDTLAWEAMKLMEVDHLKRIMVMPVLNDDHQVLGLIHLHDIIQYGV